jgi:hypothetical protein
LLFRPRLDARIQRCMSVLGSSPKSFDDRRVRRDRLGDFTPGTRPKIGCRQPVEIDPVELPDPSSRKRLEVKQSFEDGDRVILHSLVVKEKMEIAVVHIFRFAGEMIAEL